MSLLRSHALYVFLSAYHALNVMDKFDQVHPLTERWAAKVLGAQPQDVLDMDLPPELKDAAYYFKSVSKLASHISTDGARVTRIWTDIRQKLLVSRNPGAVALLRRMSVELNEFERKYVHSVDPELPFKTTVAPPAAVAVQTASPLLQMAACLMDFALLWECRAGRAARPQFNTNFHDPRMFVQPETADVVFIVEGLPYTLPGLDGTIEMLNRAPGFMTLFWETVIQPMSAEIADELVLAVRGRYRYECLLMETATQAERQHPIHAPIRTALNELGIVNHAPDADAIFAQCRRMAEEEPPEGAMYYIWVPIIEGTARDAVPDIAVQKWYSKSNDTIYEVQRRVVTAANVFHLLDGRDIVVPAARHFSPAMSMIANLLEESGMMDRKGRIGYRHEDQGFIDQFDRYLTREEAYIVANAYDRILRDRNGDDKELYSEGLH